MSDEDDTQNWTLVTHNRQPSKTKKASKSKSNKSKNFHSHSHADIPQNSRSGVLVDDKELQRTLANIKTCRDKWREDASAALSIIQQKVQNLKISKSVIAGLGNLDPDSPRDRWRAIWQLAVFLEIRALFLDITEVFAQDPAFTMFDMAVLKHFGIGVLEGDQATNKIDMQTFAFVPFIDAIVLLPRIIKEREMGFYVGTDMDEIVERMSMDGYSQSTRTRQEMVEVSLNNAKGFLERMEKLNLKLDFGKQASLLGLTAFVAKDQKEVVLQ